MSGLWHRQPLIFQQRKKIATQSWLRTQFYLWFLIRLRFYFYFRSCSCFFRYVFVFGPRNIDTKDRHPPREKCTAKHSHMRDFSVFIRLQSFVCAKSHVSHFAYFHWTMFMIMIWNYIYDTIKACRIMEIGNIAAMSRRKKWLRFFEIVEK